MQAFSYSLGPPPPRPHPLQESVLYTGTDKSACQQVSSEPQDPSLSWVLGSQGRLCLPACLPALGVGWVGAN